MAGTHFESQLSILYCWTTSPERVDTAEVDFARFSNQTEHHGPELCASFIVQELEEDLCDGHTPGSPASGPIEWGVHYVAGV